VTKPDPADETVPRALFDENTRRHQAAIARVDELLAVTERVRALHQPTQGLGYDSDEDDAPRSYGQIAQACTTCGTTDEYAVRWPCATVRALGEPGHAATGATELETTARVLSSLHRSAEADVTRVIALYEQWVKAGPPPLGAPLARWWDGRLVELHNAIQPADQTTEK